MTESMLEDEGVQRIIEGYFEVLKNFRELEFGGKIEKAANSRINPNFKSRRYKTRD